MSSTRIVNPLSSHGRCDPLGRWGTCSVQKSSLGVVDQLSSDGGSDPLGRWGTCPIQRSSTGVVDRLMEMRSLEEGRELVSKAAKLMALSPDYSIRHAFDFEKTKKGWHSRLPMEFRLPKRVESLSLGPQGSWPLAPTTQFAVPLTLSE